MASRPSTGTGKKRGTATQTAPNQTAGPLVAIRNIPNTTIMSKILLLLLISLTHCTPNNRLDNVKLVAGANLDFGISFHIEFYTDSMYLFTFINSDFNHEINEKFRGRYRLQNDTILFDPFRFDYTDATEAVLKNNFLEFLDGKHPFKLKVKRSIFPITSNIDTSKYRDYFLFTYSPKFYSIFSDSVTAYDLKNNDLHLIDSLLISMGKQKISSQMDRYFRQCIAVINTKNEIEVWVNCLCKGSMITKEEIQQRIVNVDDGGRCFFNLIFNLNTKTYHNLMINGPA